MSVIPIYLQYLADFLANIILLVNICRLKEGRKAGFLKEKELGPQYILFISFLDVYACL